MEIKIREEDEVIFVLFEVEDNTEVEKFLKEIGAWDIRLEKPIILSGTCPNWFLGIIINWFTFSPAVAIFDVNKKGAVVVATNSKKYAVGDIINLNF